MKKLKEFIKSLLSSRIMLWAVQKILFMFVFINITDQLYMIILYAINVLFDLFILNEINVKPISAKDIADIMEAKKQ